MTPPPRLVHLSDLETIYDRPEDAGRLAGAVEALRDERTIVVTTGDTTALGSLALATDEGRRHGLPFMRAVAPVASTFGNHDLDEGPGWAAEWARDVPGTHLAANLDGLAADAFEPGLLTEVDEARVGLVGVVNPRTPEMCHAVESLTFTDPVEAVRREAAALRDRGAEFVVVLSHCASVDADIAGGTDVDAVLGAHDHEQVEERVDGTLVARTRGGQANEYEVVTLGEDPAADVRDLTDAPVDGPVAAEYRERRAAAGIDEEVCSFPEPLPEAETGWAVAETYRVRGEADIGVVVAGSVRGGLPATITVGDLLGVVPFSSHLHTLAVGGEDLANAIRLGRDEPDDTHGRMYVAGASVREDGPVVVDDDPISPDATYRVACTSYLTEVAPLPGFEPDALVADHGLQYEHIIAQARAGEFGRDVE
ncbi:bifunctional metallophosphatase/5'-nucleotidase [Halorarum halobium]|uniref:bifunctional metallophosphatase/5'-nucleotidase n=1 Tax=Halorarum halobium TaxID=3075121 RepID=UPI0028AFD26A|nr:bifunctional metallophosphatase/5'-nucleotidase [Halobaculum sp. XH14]